jgi:RNA polymerase-binding transcription factor DksA
VAKKSVRKTAKKKSAAKKKAGRSAAKKKVRRSAVKKKAVSKKSTPKKAAPKKAAPKKAARKKAAPKKAAPKKAAVKKTAKTDRAARAAQPRTLRARDVLTKSELGEFRQMLLEKRAELAGDVSTLHSEALSRSRQDASGDLSNMPIHMADIGTDNYEQEFTLGLLESEQSFLREIDEALDRVADSTYGVCLATGKPIGKARLRAQPWAKYCYEHMLAREKGQASGP